MQLVQSKHPLHFTRFDRVKDTSILARASIVLLFIPLFFIDLGAKHSPITVEFFEACHCIFFFLAGLLTFPLIKLPAKQGVVWAVSAVFFLSLIIETTQEWVGRSFQWADIYRNLLGFCMGACVIIFSKTPNSARKIKAAICFCILLSLALFERSPLITQIASQLYMRTNLPILVDFEHEFELLNWSAKNATLSYSEDALFIDAKSSKKMAKVSFKHFPQDWSEFEDVVVRVENVGKGPIKVKLVIGNTEQGDKLTKEMIASPGLHLINMHYHKRVEASDINRFTLFAKSTASRDMAQLKLHSVYLEQANQANNRVSEDM
jgi:hypothetical protein